MCWPWDNLQTGLVWGAFKFLFFFSFFMSLCLCWVLLPICPFEAARINVPFHVPLDVPLGMCHLAVASAGFRVLPWKPPWCRFRKKIETAVVSLLKENRFPGGPACELGGTGLRTGGDGGAAVAYRGPGRKGKRGGSQSHSDPRPRTLSPCQTFFHVTATTRC